MPRSRSSSKPRSYGRQAAGKTIKSLSLDADLALWAENWASAAGQNFSQAINNALRSLKDGRSLQPGGPPKTPSAEDSSGAKRKTAGKVAAVKAPAKPAAPAKAPAKTTGKASVKTPAKAPAKAPVKPAPAPVKASAPAKRPAAAKNVAKKRGKK